MMTSESPSNGDEVDIELTEITNDNDDEQLLPKHRREKSPENLEGDNLPSPSKPADDNPALASDFKTFGNTVISFVGAGILGLPFAFRQAGWMLGGSVLLFVAGVSTYAMLLLIKCKDKILQNNGEPIKKKKISYGDIGRIACGYWGGFAVDASLVITQTGFCIAYLIFIATNVKALFGISKSLTIAICVPLLIAMAFLRSLKQLAPFALFADFANFLGLAVVYLSDFEYMPLDHDTIYWAHWDRLPFCFGVAIYCFEGVGMVLPLENSMQNKHKFKPILLLTVALVTIIYLTFGLCGYLAFGDETHDVITLNMPGSIMAKIVKVSLCVGLYFTYPMMLFPVFQVLESHLIVNPNSNRSLQKSKFLRTNSVIFTALVAACIPNFGVFISFIGSTCCSLLAFILPTLFYYRLCCAKQKTSPLTLIILAVIFLIGSFSMMIGINDALEHIFG